MPEILATAEWEEAMEQVDKYLEEHVAPRFGCPGCGETLRDSLVWHNVDPDETGFDDARPEYVKCQACGTEYGP